MEKLQWVTVPVKWVDMIPYIKNARKIKAVNAQKLEESLGEFDVVEIPVLDQDKVIIGGHQRRAKMVSMGRGEELTDVRMPNRKLTEAEFKKLNLLLNSDKYKGEFDMAMLNEFFSEFDLTADFDIDMPDPIDLDDDHPGVSDEPEMPIVPKFSEKYTAFVIVCENEIDENHLAERLGIETGRCYKASKLGRMHVVKAKTVIEAWK